MENRGVVTNHCGGNWDSEICKIYDVIIHISSETTNEIIADIAVAIRTGQTKIGVPPRIDRVAKYNQLLRFEDELTGRGV